MLKQMMVSFQFQGHGADNLGSGCQPFLVSYSGNANHYLAVEAASVSNQLAQGDHNASLSDYRSIREKEKIRFPSRDVTELSITLYRYAVLCQKMYQGVGPAHPFVDAMWGLACTIQNVAPFVSERFGPLARLPQIANTYYARVLRAIQLNVHDYYLQQVAINVAGGVTGAPLPLSFTALIQDLKRGTFHQSTKNWMSIPDERVYAG
jgi:hypothetical protein